MLLATLVCALAAQDTGPEVGHLAPPHAIELWVRNREAGGTRVVDGVDVGPLAPAELADWLGSVVIVHAVFSWDTRQNGLPIVRDAFKANRHRRLKAISLSAGTVSTDSLEARREKYGVEHLLAVTDVEGGSPYFVPGAGGFARAWVIDPTGSIVWKGDPVGDEREFLKALREALERYPAVPLERDASEAVLPAQALYCAGQWAEARKAAEKIERKLRGKDPDTADEALRTVERVDEQRAALSGELNALRQPFTDGGRGALRLLRAIERGFPKSDLAKRAEERLAALNNELVVPAILDDARRWVELEEDRPVLFPERKDKSGDHHARELERLLKRLTEGSSLRRLGMAQLDRYGEHE
jgi:hypothetical protein